MVKKGCQDSPVPLAFQRALWWGGEQHPGLVIAERRRHTLTVH